MKNGRHFRGVGKGTLQKPKLKKPIELSIIFHSLLTISREAEEEQAIPRSLA